LATINNKAIEYLSAGLPVISCPKTGVLASLLAHEACGLSYAYGDASDLAAILLRLDSDRDAARTMSANAGRIFRERFTAERVYAEMMAYFEEVAARSGRRLKGATHEP
jgi:glycosyltransferase involved in cell wall biosynthesis